MKASPLAVTGKEVKEKEPAGEQQAEGDAKKLACSAGQTNAKGGGSVLGAKAPKRKARKPFSDFVSYWLVRVVILVFNILPQSLAYALGRTLGWLAWALSARYRKQIVRHMTIAFRDKMPLEEKQRLCKLNFKHVGQSIAEFARMTRMRKETQDSWIDISNMMKVEEILEKQPVKRGKRRGLLLVIAHHGNWELGGYAAALKGYPIKSVARPLDHPKLNELIKGMREKSGNEIIEKYQVLWKLKKLLDSGGIVTMSIDQNGGVAGEFIPMFTSLASTVASPAELQLVTKCPIIVGSFNRQQDWKSHKFEIWDIIEFEKSGKHEEDRRRILTRINKAYEKAIEAYPEQWLWVHKRWKSRPKDEKPTKDGLPPEIE